MLTYRFINGWKYGNCDYGLPGTVTKLLQKEKFNDTDFQYSYSVIAIAGIGLIQNANHAYEWIMGAETMMDYYDRILLSESDTGSPMADSTFSIVIKTNG